MMNIQQIKKAARKTVDDNNQPVVQIPLTTWENWVASSLSTGKSQRERILDLLHQWQDDSSEEMPEEWWKGLLKGSSKSPR